MTKQKLITLVKGLGISTKFLLGVFIISASSFIYVALAEPPGEPYNLGETLAPTCAPGDVNCTVDTPQEGNVYLTDIASITANKGDVIYFNGIDWVDLAPGTSGQFLKTNGASANPAWATPAGSGNVSTSGTPAQHDFAKFVDGTDIEGRSYAEVRTDLGLVIGTNVQAFDADLTDLADGTLSKSKVEDFTNWDTAFGWGDHSGEGYLTTIGTQNLDALQNVDTLTEADDDILFYDTDGWNRLVHGTDGQVLKYTDAVGIGWSDESENSLWTDQGTYYYPNNYPNFVVMDSGNVGIGINSPSEKLDILGDMKLSGDIILSSGEWISFNGVQNSPPGIFYDPGDSTFRIVGGTDKDIVLAPAGTNDKISIQQGGFAEVAHIKGNGDAYFAGNVGIGTTSPEYILDINSGDSEASVRINSDSLSEYAELTASINGVQMGAIGGFSSGFALPNLASSFAIKSDIGNLGIGAVSSDANIVLYAGGISSDEERMRITYDGKVGIGTDSPIHKFQVSGSDDTGRILIHDSDGNNDDEAGLLFAVSGDLSASPSKAGIFFNRTETYGRGDLLFAINGTANSTEVSKSDAKITLGRLGDLRLGDGSPIHISGEGELYVDQYIEVRKGIYVGDMITHRDDINTSIEWGDDAIRFNAGSLQMLTMTENDPNNLVVVNEGGADVDFRIESETNANMFFMDAENDLVGIGTGHPFNDVGSGDGNYRHVSGLHIAKLTTNESGGLIVEGGASAFIDLVDRGSSEDDKIMRIFNSEGNLFFYQLKDDVSGADFTWMTFERHGNVGVRTDSPTVIFEVACPSGFTNVKGGNNQLGCIQTAERGNDSYEKAQDDCFDTYGGRLPTTGELFIAMDNYALTDETDDWERCDDHIYSGGGDQHSVAARGDISTQSGGDDGDTVDYRCWLPR